MFIDLSFTAIILPVIGIIVSGWAFAEALMRKEEGMWKKAALGGLLSVLALLLSWYLSSSGFVGVDS